MIKSKCKLCLEESADHINSHIISKFLGKRLFEHSKPRHSVQLRRKGKVRKIYDIPSETNIFCLLCEKRMEILETLFAKHLNNLHKYKRLSVKFKLNTLNDQQYLSCLEINPIEYKLFIYLLVWRTSISSLDEFEKFKIPESDQ